MKSKLFGRTALTIAVLLMIVSVSALAEDLAHKKFSGSINGYTPQVGATGPYEFRGPWSLTTRGESGKAVFSAALNMELSDGWVITKNNSDFTPSARGAHTHHITFNDGTVTRTANGFEVTGTATITLNGNPAPISPSVLTIEITGGSDVEFSNITLTFQAPASNHFGSGPLPGVVRSVRWEECARERR